MERIILPKRPVLRVATYHCIFHFIIDSTQRSGHGPAVVHG